VIAAAITAQVCVALLAALVMVLRHLAAMRATDGEVAKMTAAITDLGKQWNEALAKNRQLIDDHEARLTNISNRIGR
jgi:uncharacterized protein YoxC